MTNDLAHAALQRRAYVPAPQALSLTLIAWDALRSAASSSDSAAIQPPGRNGAAPDGEAGGYKNGEGALVLDACCPARHLDRNGRRGRGYSSSFVGLAGRDTGQPQGDISSSLAGV